MKKIKVAVVGVGHLGQYHAQKYQLLSECELVAICDIDRARCKTIAEQLNTTAIDDYTLLKGKVDAVSIAVPTNLHHKIAKFFLAHGIHVLVEKPMAATLAEAEDLLNIANKNNCVLQIGHVERFNPAFQQIHTMIATPLFIQASRLANFKIRGTDVDVILDLMIHDIDLVQAIAKSKITKIRATGASLMSPLLDESHAVIEFANGCLAHLNASRISTKIDRTLNILQNDSSYQIDLHAKKIIICSSQGQKQIDCENVDALNEQIQAFLKAIMAQQKPVVSGEDGFNALATALQITQIAQHGAPLK